MPIRGIFIIIQKISTRDRFIIKYLMMKNIVDVKYSVRHATNIKQYAKHQKSSVINKKNIRLLY